MRTLQITQSPEHCNPVEAHARRSVTDRSALLTVYDGREAIGFIVRRGPAGAEGFDTANVSLGLFENEPAAATAIWKQARGQTAEGGAP
jgi:hypothetical protein